MKTVNVKYYVIVTVKFSVRQQVHCIEMKSFTLIVYLGCVVYFLLV